jgi:hypothetical protein
MKILKKLFFVFTASVIFNACQPGKESFENSESLSADSIKNDAPLSSTAATYQDEKRKFIRTADLNMEVENVYKSTQKIEMKIAELGGFVTQSNLESEVLSEKTFPIDVDSAYQVKNYIVNNKMILRIPSRELGSFLNSLNSEMKFLYFRNISAEDVSINFIVSEMEKERLQTTNQKLDQINEEGGKVKDKMNVVETIDRNNSQKNLQKYSDLKMQDEIAFSTVNLYISEKEKVSQTKIINAQHFDEKFHPKFAYRANNAIQDGFYLFQSICIGLLYFWPFLIILLILTVIFRKQIRKKKING